MNGKRARVAPGRIAITAALVLVGCVLGARAGTWLRFPGVGAALLFLPYAVVTSALLRTPPRYWWLLLLAASAGNLVPHLLDGASVGFALGAELVNQLRAVLAAVGIRRFASSGRLETLWEAVAYVAFAAFLGPAIAALGGAWLVTAHGAAGVFWLAWQEWWLSNAITGLTVLPLLTLELSAWRAAPRVAIRRITEVSLALLAVAVSAAYVFAQPHERSQSHPAHLYWALPFLLWAAVRVGPRGTSAAVLVVTALSMWGASEGRGPFAPDTPTENLLEVQVFLLAVSVPLFMLASLIRQERSTAEALRQSRRQFRSVVEDQTEMICRFRPDGSYTFANRAYEEAFALTADGVASGSVWALVPASVHSSSGDLPALTPSSPVATREVNVAAPAGTPRWQQWRERGLFDERGALVEVQAVGRDVTDRKIAEDERRELEARKSAEVALLAANQRKDEFVAMLGHELRNPLAPIGVALEILRAAPSGSADAAWALDSIASQLSHMTRLIDDLLDISRVTLGKIELQLETVDLGSVITKAAQATRPLIDSLGHRLLISLPDQPVLVRGDAVRLTQIIDNLLNNAAKYTDRGGRIELELARSEAGLRLSVRDNGVGIAADALERIFEPFSQIPSAQERARGGLGIGLTLVRRLVELHGGTVEARSEGANRGCELIVQLPPELVGVVQAAAPPPSTVERHGALRVLAVDDNFPMAQALTTMLRIWGHTVRTAYDGIEALEIARAFTPDVVLLDLSLPGVDGLEVARRLRLAAARPPALLISMSGFGQETIHQRSDEAGFHHHLVKPFDMEVLRALIDDTGRRTQPAEPRRGNRSRRPA